jgi:hypothetical protein
MAGVTTISAPTTRTSRVVLTSDVLIGPDGRGGSSQVVLTGHGRFYGVVLSQTQSRSRPLTVVAASLGGCFSAGCEPSVRTLRRTFVTADGAETTASGAYRVPRGTYDLTVFTDGSPVAAQFTFPTLRGHTTMRPGSPWSVAYENPRPTGAGSAASAALYSAGSTHGFDGVGLMLYDFYYRAEPHVAHQAGGCFYLNERPPLDLPALTCPQGGSDGGVNIISAWLDVSGAQAGGAVAYSPGAWYQGVYSDGVQYLSQADVSLMWLPLP